MTAAEFLRDKALKEDLPEFAAIADTLDDYDELKKAMHYYATAYARLKAALRVIAETDKPTTFAMAQKLARKALSDAEDQ